MQQDRLELERDTETAATAGFAADVLRGLSDSPKHLSSKYFYDELGSALFEAICLIPEYYLTRAETEIFLRHAEEIAGALEGPVRLVELGSGNSQKTRLLIEALLSRQHELVYEPVDISQELLEQTARSLENDYAGLRVNAITADYTKEYDIERSRDDERVLVLFLGSNIGNYNRSESISLIRNVRRLLTKGDGFLVGADLKKPERELVSAYDDPLGVTAAFNLNLLRRINDELGGNFDLREFDHRAIYNAREGRMEMFLVSRKAAHVHISELNLDVTFEPDEAVHTEYSYKFDLEGLQQIAGLSGFNVRHVWLDSLSRFSSNLWVAN